MGQSMQALNSSMDLRDNSLQLRARSEMVEADRSDAFCSTATITKSLGCSSIATTLKPSPRKDKKKNSPVLHSMLLFRGSNTN
jgi:hypothetical protein